LQLIWKLIFQCQRVCPLPFALLGAEEISGHLKDTHWTIPNNCFGLTEVTEALESAQRSAASNNTPRIFACSITSLDV